MTQAELIAAIEKMSVLELSQLVKALEEKFGVSSRRAGRGADRV
jgi:ribosomal protein L7/L12